LDEVIQRFAGVYQGERPLKIGLLAQALATVLLDRWQWLLEDSDWTKAAQILKI